MSNKPSLTSRQEQVLAYIREQVAAKGYPPSVREIGDALGLSSSSTVHSHLASLEEKGYLRRDPSKPRALEVIDNEPAGVDAPQSSDTLVAFAPQPDFPVEADNIRFLPLVGQVAAGAPILAEENIEEELPFPATMVGSGASFMLKVKGDSMIEAGIFDGDYVVVKQQQTANNGDIVVALLDDEATVKTFYKERDHIRLQPENSALAPILTRDVRIVGKVVALFRAVS